MVVATYQLKQHALPSQATQPNNRKLTCTHILGHRGARGEAPENTLVGFTHTQNLLKQGIYGIEFDVQLTKDGELAVFHDDNLMRCCGKQSRLNELTRSAIGAFKQNPLCIPFVVAPQPISFLDDIYPLLTGYQHIELEIKTHQRTNYHLLVQALKNSLKHAPKHLPIILTSFDTKLLFLLKQVLLKQARIDFAMGLLIENQHVQPHWLIHQIKQLGCVQVGIQHTLINKTMVDTLHRANIAITAWTVNNTNDFYQLSSWGVNNIITDYPSQFLSLC